MDFYEELGVSRSASTEEIRQAYKRLARLLHPDQCADAEMRALAELQMRRLNGVAATLTDPVERQRYDAVLAQGRALSAPRPAPPPATPAARARLWLDRAAAGATAVALLWAIVPARQPAAAPPSPAAVERAAPAPRRSTRERRAAARPAPEPAAGPETHETARRESPPPRRETQARPTASPRAETAAGAEAPPAEFHPPAAPPAPTRTEKPSPEDAPRFAGNWYYVPSGARPRDLYPPEYIELRLAEKGGKLSGRYRARYRVTDRAIPPTVSFEFAGAAHPPAATLAWNGPGGAAGQTTLKLLTENTLEIAWRAHRLSDEIGLVSGVAVLVRELER